MTAARLAVLGVTGRMGRALVRLAAADPGWQLVAALTAADDPQHGQDAGQLAGVGPLGVTVGDTFDGPADVLIDFSTPRACVTWAKWCATHGAALVSGTTGLADDERAALTGAARHVPVVWAPNMSVGVNLLIELVGQVAARLGAGWDIEITEAHHRHKVDAPSGTARALYEAACRGRGFDPAAAAVPGRSGQCGPRGADEIGVHALRLGAVVGDHDVHFAADGEIVTLSHRALSRDTFAAGALRAARWVLGRAPGQYTMRDVLA
jgi:4-hydroxy-tetrahydrodipicolinate reductase